MKKNIYSLKTDRCYKNVILSKSSFAFRWLVRQKVFGLLSRFHDRDAFEGQVNSSFMVHKRHHRRKYKGECDQKI